MIPGLVPGLADAKPVLYMTVLGVFSEMGQLYVWSLSLLYLLTRFAPPFKSYGPPS